MLERNQFLFAAAVDELYTGAVMTSALKALILATNAHGQFGNPFFNERAALVRESGQVWHGQRIRMRAAHDDAADDQQMMLFIASFAGIAGWKLMTIQGRWLLVLSTHIITHGF